VNDKILVGGFGCLFVAAILLIFGAIGAAILMILWNWIMPYLFGLPEINFWMAWGILALLGVIGNTLRPTVTVEKS
jgi:hypothetical protein